MARDNTCVPRRMVGPARYPQANGQPTKERMMTIRGFVELEDIRVWWRQVGEEPGSPPESLEVRISVAMPDGRQVEKTAAVVARDFAILMAIAITRDGEIPTETEYEAASERIDRDFPGAFRFWP